ncbi:MAG: hypothetical protein PF487_08885 [Bacteroidales bacterium]|jgi:hypothetical protein|nr:hypothetical protein [Bacteroidales bacterium]
MNKEISIIFRKFSNGDIIALFPYIVEDYKGCVMCYEHIGQHGIASYNHIINQTKLATEEEYSDLLNELNGIYWDLYLKPLKRMNGRIYKTERKTHPSFLRGWDVSDKDSELTL